MVATAIKTPWQVYCVECDKSALCGACHSVVHSVLKTHQFMAIEDSPAGAAGSEIPEHHMAQPHET